MTEGVFDIMTKRKTNEWQQVSTTCTDFIALCNSQIETYTEYTK